MKKDIHPKVYEATMECACGFKDQLLTTKGDHVYVEICSNCHPLYTGKQRDHANKGRIGKFNERYGNLDAQIQEGTSK